MSMLVILSIMYEYFTFLGFLQILPRLEAHSAPGVPFNGGGKIFEYLST